MQLACMAIFFAMCLAANCIRQMCCIWKNSSPIPSSGLAQTMNSYLVEYFKYNPFVKLYMLRVFVNAVGFSCVNHVHVCGKCSVNSNACITNKHTVLTNIFNEVTVTAC